MLQCACQMVVRLHLDRFRQLHPTLPFPFPRDLQVRISSSEMPQRSLHALLPDQMQCASVELKQPGSMSGWHGRHGAQ